MDTQPAALSEIATDDLIAELFELDPIFRNRFEAALSAIEPAADQPS